MLSERQKIVIDELTPMFVAMMEELSPLKRKVVATAAHLNQMVSAKDIASYGRYSVNVISTTLGRLVKDGIMVDYSIHPRKKQYDFSYKYKWLAIWLRVRRTGDNK